MTALRGVIGDNCGATSIEYGLLAALIALGVVTSVQDVGKSVNSAYEDVQDALGKDKDKKDKDKGPKK